MNHAKPHKATTKSPSSVVGRLRPTPGASSGACASASPSTFACASATLDAILLEGLRVECIIGDLPHERTFPQELFLDLELGCDLRPAARSDALADTVNYVAVAEAVRTALTEGRCQMVERAAQLAADAALATDPRIVSVRVTLRKPHALPGVVAGVRLFRQRP